MGFGSRFGQKKDQVPNGNLNNGVVNIPTFNKYQNIEKFDEDVPKQNDSIKPTEIIRPVEIIKPVENIRPVETKKSEKKQEIKQQEIKEKEKEVKKIDQQSISNSRNNKNELKPQSSLKPQIRNNSVNNYFEKKIFNKTFNEEPIISQTENEKIQSLKERISKMKETIKMPSVFEITNSFKNTEPQTTKKM